MRVNLLMWNHSIVYPNSFIIVHHILQSINWFLVLNGDHNGPQIGQVKHHTEHSKNAP